MAIKLNNNESVFRNDLIFTADAKAVNIDYTLVNLFMLLKHNGMRPRQRARKGKSSQIEIDQLISLFQKLELTEDIEGFQENPEAVELWLRTNLVNLVFRGNMEKEKISSLRPIHLESYRIRNAKNTRDYFSADQVYLMLGEDPSLKEELKTFLAEGWDKTTDSLVNSKELDVNTLGVLHLIKNIKPGFMSSQSSLNRIKPLLPEQAKLYCEDVRRLLVYKSKIPRNVLIDYLKTITSFHLSLYIHKLIYLLPKMIEAGSKNVEDDWSIVIDTTDDFNSKISSIAIQDATHTFNSLYDYIKSGFKVNALIYRLKLDDTDSSSVDKALYLLKNKIKDYEINFETYWDLTLEEQDEADQELMIESVQYENTYFERYVELLMKEKGAYQLKYYPQFLDAISQKNSERGFLAQGKSKKHPRRYVLGTKLLEALVQIQVLELDEERNKYVTKSLSIEELLDNFRSCYGLIITGIDEERFKDADLPTHLAFKENIEAFKSKLRQIGFFNDLSDAYILQRIRPRYELS